MKGIYYCDMDGVVADFEGVHNSVQRFKTEKDFFYNLAPIEENVRALRELSVDNEIFILSASPNARCDNDKRKWLAKYMPFIKEENIIICRNGQKKVDFMRTPNGVLFDDYGKNCREWCERKGNTSHKITKEFTIRSYIQTF